jgi:hypothetical protein
MKAKINDIIYVRWGVTMTLYNFYIVDGFSKSGKSIYLSQLKNEYIKTNDRPNEAHCPVIPSDIRLEDKRYTKKLKKDDYVVLEKCIYVNLDNIWDRKEIFYENHID